MHEYISSSLEETQDLAQKISRNLSGGSVLCLQGDLGSGKTTFTQGLLSAFGAEKPYVSPTFLIMKEYRIHETHNAKPVAKDGVSHKMLGDASYKIRVIYHIDAYRISSNDMKLLGWDELITNKHALIVIEWPEKIQDVLPDHSQWLHFEWLDEHTRKITQK